MITRLLETKKMIRSTVQTAALVKATATGVVLKTTAAIQSKKQLSSADSDMLVQHKVGAIGQEVHGRVNIDILSDTVVRVRYAEGTAVGENKTPMVIGAVAAPKRCVVTASKTGVVAKTAAITVTITFSPYRIEITDKKGTAICGIGGKEKNYFCHWDSYNTGLCRDLNSGTTLAVENFDLAYDECIYGLGEQFIKFNKAGQTIDLNMDDALGVMTPRAYKNIPFYVSNRGYGVYFNHSSLMTYWVGSMAATDVQVAAQDDFLDYYIFTGSIKEVLSSYTDLTGKGVMPPRWTFGYWQSKISYVSAEETLEIADKMRANKIPCDVIHLDTHWFKADWYCDLTFAKDRFPDPADYFAKLAQKGIKVSLWQLPYIPEGSNLYNELKAVDGFVKTTAGEIYNCGICFTPGFKGIVGVIDYTNPKATQIHQKYFRTLFRMGAKVVKTDFGEAAPLDGVYFDGTPGHKMHNLYPLLYNKALFDVTKEETGDGVVWARSAWAGSQRFPLHWGGDNSPNYPNLAPQIIGGLSFGMSGFQFWSQDIGGFLSDTYDELLIRWMQIGMFNSHSRIHGGGNRELYKFKPKTIAICRDYINLRYQLMPYIWGSAEACVKQSLPLMRPLVVEYQDDPNVLNMSDEFLFGNDILVAPIFDASNKRKVYLPAGQWTDWWTKKRINGGQWLSITAPLDTLPLYIREGAIIPMGPVMNYVEEVPYTALTIMVSLLSGDGSRRFIIPVNKEKITVDYRAVKGKHSIKTSRTKVILKFVPIGKGKLVRVKK